MMYHIEYGDRVYDDVVAWKFLGAVLRLRLRNGETILLPLDKPVRIIEIDKRAT